MLLGFLHKLRSKNYLNVLFLVIAVGFILHSLKFPNDYLSLPLNMWYA